jgi:hypothetical protein
MLGNGQRHVFNNHQDANQPMFISVRHICSAAPRNVAASSVYIFCLPIWVPIQMDAIVPRSFWRPLYPWQTPRIKLNSTPADIPLQ